MPAFIYFISFTDRMNKMKVRLIGLLLLVCCKQYAFAQIDNSVLTQNININETDSGKAGFNINVLNYMRNTEYFNRIELGRTLFGYQVNPSVSYQVNKHFKIQGGIFARNDFGGDEVYTQLLPTFTLKTNFHNFQMLFGTLEGAASHRIIEPMFDIARVIEHRVENGFQLKYRSNQTFFDTWINWEKFIERNSPHKEKFTAGLNYMRLVTPQLNKFKCTLIGQGMISHAGGQIDKDTINPLTMQLNCAVGAKLGYDLRKNENISIDFYKLFYSETSSSGLWPFEKGDAFYSNFTYQYHGFNAVLSYFYGMNYLSPRGTAIYQSQSIDVPSRFESKRLLFIPRLIYNKTIFDALQMSARFEPVIDLNTNIFDYSYSFYLSYQLEKIFK